MPRGPRRVWITGLGIVTPVGIGLDAFWEGLHAGRSPVKRIDRFDPRAFRSQVAAQIDDFEPTDHMDAKTARQTDRFSHFALAAGRLAIADARVESSSFQLPWPTTATGRWVEPKGRCGTCEVMRLLCCADGPHHSRPGVTRE